MAESSLSCATARVKEAVFCDWSLASVVNEWNTDR